MLEWIGDSEINKKILGDDIRPRNVKFYSCLSRFHGQILTFEKSHSPI